MYTLDKYAARIRVNKGCSRLLLHHVASGHLTNLHSQSISSVSERIR
jgi:hypothetical protein